MQTNLQAAFSFFTFFPAADAPEGFLERVVGDALRHIRYAHVESRFFIPVKKDQAAYANKFASRFFIFYFLPDADAPEGFLERVVGAAPRHIRYAHVESRFFYPCKFKTMRIMQTNLQAAFSFFNFYRLLTHTWDRLVNTARL